MRDKVFSYFGVSPDDPDWHDWKWQYRHRISSVETLAAILALSESEKQDIAQSLGSFRMAITPYYAALMDPDDPACPLRMQAVPSILEMARLPWEASDPLNEEGDSPVPHLVRRYPDRALFLVTRQCAMYCRHCVRKHYVGEEDARISEAEIDAVVRYIADTPEIRDVLVSGGDPLTMDDQDLEYILSRLRAIPHVEIIRIGTRVPVVMPMRITPALLAMLRKYHPIWVNTHFNHPLELTPEAKAACEAIVDAGIPLGNQSVLLRHINDDLDTMKTLLLKLVQARVRPYYIYQCDLFEGSEHFRTRVETGMAIMQGLTGHISGLAIPRFVIDAPEGGGKVPINPETIVSFDDTKVQIRNYQGKVYTYPQPKMP